MARSPEVVTIHAPCAALREGAVLRPPFALTAFFFFFAMRLPFLPPAPRLDLRRLHQAPPDARSRERQWPRRREEFVPKAHATQAGAGLGPERRAAGNVRRRHAGSALGAV